MTWRGAGLMLVPVAVVAIGAAVPAMLIVGLVLFLVCAAAVVVDSRRAPGRAALGVDPFGPVQLMNKRLLKKKLAVGPIEYVVETVAVRLDE